MTEEYVDPYRQLTVIIATFLQVRSVAEEHVNRFNRQLRFVVALCAVSLLWAMAPTKGSPTFTANAQPTRPKAGDEVIGVELRPVKTRVGQTCPANLTFYGSITTNGATTVEYLFVSSDGRSWPKRTLKFSAGGTKGVSQNWKLGQPGKKVDKWLQLEILSPNRVKSKQAPVTLNCAK